MDIELPNKFEVFNIINDFLELPDVQEHVNNKISEYVNQFADIKDINIGDKVEFKLR